ncbi:hypothetical protein RhiirA5_438178 [Rhizophagus irregularis]|uniref:Uncharacterized protein n=1 Tax=Rhizophagus irregularis TaxID=588596 RepID=A0A2N0NJH2_9GLOM|nr:hypothetical protein RhiirA5_438178 [Rhizophagus irregularis]
MFLNNKYIDKQICNGTIGIVTDMNKEQEIVRVAFCINRGIVDVEIYLDNNINKASLHLDDQIFAPDQAYHVAISRCRFLDDVIILFLTLDAFKADEKVKKEYIRLEEIIYLKCQD